MVFFSLSELSSKMKAAAILAGTRILAAFVVLRQRLPVLLRSTHDPSVQLPSQG
jgi:hypothetical protein